jgi:hypothetical protein
MGGCAVRVYAFNEAGMEAVRRWHAAALGRTASLDDLGSLAEDERLLRPIGHASEELIPEVAPATRFDAAALLHEHLQPLVAAGDVRPSADDGFWTWLAAGWREHLVKPNGSFGELARWVSNLRDSRRYYRHLLAAPYLLYARHEDRPERVRFLLANALHTPGEFAGQIGATTGLAASRAALEVAAALYWDLDEGSALPRARSKGAGSVRRLSRMMNQFARTYSLVDLEADGLDALLPDEFRAS